VPATTVIGVPNVLAVSSEMSEDLAYEITRAMFENIADLQAVHPAANQTTVEFTLARRRSRCIPARSATTRRSAPRSPIACASEIDRAPVMRSEGGFGPPPSSSAFTRAVAADELVATAEDGTEIARLPVPDGAGWCVLWNHSVQGFPVTDCYENRAGQMVLVRSHQPDFAAGLDHIPGRGRQVSDGAGGYWISISTSPCRAMPMSCARAGDRSITGSAIWATRSCRCRRRCPRERVRIELTEGTKD
jgi:hypothetical protein